eukprot:217312-Pyramimonas_sp.AAC.1
MLALRLAANALAAGDGPSTPPPRPAGVRLGTLRTNQVRACVGKYRTSSINSGVGNAARCPARSGAWFLCLRGRRERESFNHAFCALALKRLATL